MEGLITKVIDVRDLLEEVIDARDLLEAHDSSSTHPLLSDTLTGLTLHLNQF